MTARATPQASPAHLGALTGIRGLAAWLVVFYHARLSLGTLFPPDAIAAFAKGYLAVDLFFVLSGFVLWYNYAGRLRGGGAEQTVAFLWRRLARIWPLHAFILIVFMAFVVLLSLTGRDTSGYPLGELPLHLLLMQNWGFTAELTWNHPAWSISTEWAAYLFFPLAVVALRWDRLPSWLLVLAALALMAGLHAVFVLYGADTLGKAITRIGVLRCLFEFSLGNIACVLWQRWRETRGTAWLAALASLAIAAAGLLLRLPESAFVPALFFTAILALALDRGPVARALSGKVMVYLGEISYSTYLVHFLLFILFKIAFVDASLQLGWGGLLGFMALLSATSVCLYHGVEKPAQRWLNRHRPERLLARSAVAAE